MLFPVTGRTGRVHRAPVRTARKAKRFHTVYSVIKFTLSRINVSCFAIAGPTRSSRNWKFSAFIYSFWLVFHLNLTNESIANATFISTCDHFLAQHERSQLRLAWDNRHNVEVSNNSFFLRRFSLRPITNTFVTSREHTGDIYGPYVRAVRQGVIFDARTYGRQKTRPYVRAVRPGRTYHRLHRALGYRDASKR